MNSAPLSLLLATTCLTLTGLAPAQEMGPFASQSAAQVVEFPLENTGEASLEGSMEFTSNPDALLELLQHQTIQMIDVPLPTGESVVLNLERNGGQVLPPLNLYVDGEPVVHDSLDQSLWMGKVAGAPESSVCLGFASYGSYGWIYLDGEYIHLSSFPGPNGEWSQAGSRMILGEALHAMGPTRSLSCDAEISGIANPSRDLHELTVPAQASLMTGTLECKVAIESDFEYFLKWGSVNACVNYTNFLLAFVSFKFASELDVVLTYPYFQIYTTPLDPWILGPDTDSALDTFRSGWGAVPRNGANLAHFLSGRDLGGGRAYIEALCGNQDPFAVSGNLDGGVLTPSIPSAANWDFFVVCHELGHNFGALHTHNYCPPIDQCDTANSQCSFPQVCSTGTLMSYCHACGSNNVGDINPTFGSQIAIIMRNHALTCLPPYAPCTPDSFEPNNTAVTGAVLNPGTYADLNFCDTDNTDIYLTAVSPGMLYRADVDFTHSTLTDINATLYLQNGPLVDSSITFDDNESVEWLNTTNQVQVLVLWLNIVAVGTGPHSNDNLYDLTVERYFPNISEFCTPAEINSDGMRTHMFATPGSGIGANIRMTGIDGPVGEFGYILVSDATNNGLIISNGRYCLTGSVGRYNIPGGALNSLGQFDTDNLFINLSGTAQFGYGFDVPNVLPYVGSPTISVGDTYHFQLWHREPNGQANFSNGVSVTF